MSRAHESRSAARYVVCLSSSGVCHGRPPRAHAHRRAAQERRARRGAGPTPSSWRAGARTRGEGASPGAGGRARAGRGRGRLKVGGGADGAHPGPAAVLRREREEDGGGADDRGQVLEHLVVLQCELDQVAGEVLGRAGAGGGGARAARARDALGRRGEARHLGEAPQEDKCVRLRQLEAEDVEEEAPGLRNSGREFDVRRPRSDAEAENGGRRTEGPLGPP